MRRIAPIEAAALLAALILAWALAAGSASASAQVLSPWFHLTSVARPGLLQTGGGKRKVQDVTVTGSTGEAFVLADLTPEEVKEIKEGTRPFEKLAIFEVGAEPHAIQEGLEGIYGAGNVEVTGAPGAQLGLAPYEVSFKGALAEASVGLINSELSAEVGFAGGVAVKWSVADELAVIVANVGDATADATKTPVGLIDKLPAGLSVVFAEGNSLNKGTETRGPVACATKSSSEVECTFSGTLPPFDQLEVVIGVAVEAGTASGELNEDQAFGAGAPRVAIKHPIAVAKKAGEATPFGIEGYEQVFEEAGGAPDSQAGSHPFQLTTTLELNQTSSAQPAALAKDLSFKLPAGLIGNPTAYPRCTLAQFSTIVNSTTNECPADTVIGVAVADYSEEERLQSATSPIFNLEPSNGEPARFGFEPAGVPVFLDTSVRTGEDYGVTAHVENIPQLIGFLTDTATFWGVPGDPRHDNVRGYGCLAEIDGVTEEERRLKGFPPCSHLEESNPPPFLALPTSCAGPLPDSVEVDSWEDPHTRLSFPSEPTQEPLEGSMQAMNGCSSLAFDAEVKVSPEVRAASSPSGLNVDVHVPQQEALNAKGLAPAEVKSITATLPEGLALNPAAAGGLRACSEEQVALSSAAEAMCPEPSKIAKAMITTPLLPNPLKGFVYLASPQNFAGPPQENPFKSLIAMYLVAKDPVSGVLVKLAGNVSLSATGQITTTFANNPQLPFEDASLEFFGEARAPLATPSHCGTYVTNAAFEPWSNTGAAQQKLASSSQFAIDTGPGGSPCPGAALPFAPTLAAEATSVGAGAFTPLSTSLSREDGQQSLSSVQVRYPPGLAGLLTGVKLCRETEANAGTCGQESLIGESVVSVGLGSAPFTVTGGRAYLTEQYDGAPFGLSIVTVAAAGPLELEEGRPVVVRAKVEVDPRTTALTVTTDTVGPHAIPTVLDGIPLQIKHINVTASRPRFAFNPTNCEPLTILGTIDGSGGASATLSVPFQVANCATLAFAPKLTASVAGHASKRDGASVRFKIAYPPHALGSQAWFKETKIDLPKQLPARLETLQKACLAVIFEFNRSACPLASQVGRAVVRTPVLPVPLSGSVYLVSYGGQKLPEAVMALHGYGLTVELHGETFIDKRTGVTSVTFRNLPDVPFEAAEVTLPSGRFSEFGTNLPAKDPYNLCGQALTMPTLLVAANGAEIERNTGLHITGCARKKPRRARSRR